MLPRTQPLIQVPPPNLVDEVPIGSSSASVYPGYSPAHHVYGEAANESGTNASRTGWKPPSAPDAPQYEIGVRSHLKRSKLEAERAPMGGGPETAEVVTGKESEPRRDAEEARQDVANPFFVIDTNPTPVTGTKLFFGELPDSEATEVKEDRKDTKEKKKNKARKIKKEEAVAQEPLPLAEEKRSKKNKKRKREVEGAAADAAAAAESTDATKADDEGEKANKKGKKSKEGEVSHDAEEEVAAEHPPANGEAAGEVVDKMKKKKKKKAKKAKSSE